MNFEPNACSAANRVLACVLATLLAIGHAGLPSAAAAPANEIASFTLDNGMQVVVIPDHRVPIVAHSVWYKVGSVDDGPGLSGRAHFLEHMMFKATKKYPKRYLDLAVANAGGYDNATTNYDVTSYYEVVPKQFLSEMMAFEADRMTNIQFTGEELEIERGAILQERKMRIDSSPINRLKERMRAELYAGTNYELMPAGTEEGDRAVTTASAFELYRRTYGPNNAILVVAGDVSLEEVQQLAKQHFGAVPRMAEPPSRPSGLDSRPISVKRFQERDAQVTYPGLGRYYRIPAEDSEDYYPLFILMNHLNIYTGRLNTELVQKLHVASSVGAEIESTRLGALFGIGGTAAPGVPLATLESALDAALEDIRRNGVQANEVDRLVKAIESQIVFDQDDIVQRMSDYGEYLAAGRSMDWIDSRVTRMKRVTAADVARVAQHYLAPENAITGELLPAAQSISIAP